MSKIKEVGKAVCAAIRKVLERGVSVQYRRTVTLDGKPAHQVTATLPIHEAKGEPPDETAE